MSSQEIAGIDRPLIYNISASELYAVIAERIKAYLNSSGTYIPLQGQGNEEREVSLQEFYQGLRKGEESGYLRDHYIGDVLSELERTIYSFLELENWFLSTRAARARWFWLFAGASGTGSSRHLDVMCSSAWNLVLQGQKQWKIFSPRLGVDQRLLPRGLLTIHGVSQEDVVIELTQRQGDVLLIPSGWSHEVSNVGVTLAVTGNFINERNYPIVRHYLAAAGDTDGVAQLEALRRNVQVERARSS